MIGLCNQCVIIPRHQKNQEASSDCHRPKWQLRQQSRKQKIHLLQLLHGDNNLKELICCDIQHQLDLWIVVATFLATMATRVGAIEEHGLHANTIIVYDETHALQDRCLDEGPCPRPVAAFVAKVNQGLPRLTIFLDHLGACERVIQPDVLPHAPAAKLVRGQDTGHVHRVRPQVSSLLMAAICPENAAIRRKNHIATI